MWRSYDRNLEELIRIEITSILDETGFTNFINQEDKQEGISHE